MLEADPDFAGIRNSSRHLLRHYSSSRNMHSCRIDTTWLWISRAFVACALQGSIVCVVREDEAFALHLLELGQGVQQHLVPVCGFPSSLSLPLRQDAPGLASPQQVKAAFLVSQLSFAKARLVAKTASSRGRFLLLHSQRRSSLQLRPCDKS